MIEEDVREFIRRLPDIDEDTLGQPGAHLIMLVMRSRYTKELSGVKAKDIVVERKIIRPTIEYTNEWRENYFQKIYNLSVLREFGHYTIKDVVMDNRTLGILGTISPRKVTKATTDILRYIGDRFDDRTYSSLSRLDIEFFAACHKHKIRHPFFVTLDVDNFDRLQEVRNEVSVYRKWMITRTSRGAHVILNLDTEQARTDFYRGGGTWEKNHSIWGDDVELARDSQEPIPGTFYFNPSRENNHVTIIE